VSPLDDAENIKTKYDWLSFSHHQQLNNVLVQIIQTALLGSYRLDYCNLHNKVAVTYQKEPEHCIDLGHESRSCCCEGLGHVLF
jgi:hypothetical protein